MHIIKRIVMIILVVLNALSVVITYCWIDAQSGVILLIFNVFFFSLFSQLKGAVCVKLFLLTTGNVIGLVWSYCFHTIVFYSIAFEVAPTTTLHVIYTIVYPFLNTFWVLAFWSLSATVLNGAKNLPREHYL